MNYFKIIFILHAVLAMHDHSAPEFSGRQWLDPAHATKNIFNFLQQARKGKIMEYHTL